MKTRDALKEFESFLADKNVDIHGAPPKQGLMALVLFYRDVRAEDVELMADGDMLLYQWGTHDWGQGERFELNLTRQLMYVEGEDDDTFQLSLTYVYAPTDELRALGNHEQWCFHPEELDELLTALQASEPYMKLQTEPAQEVELNFGTAG